MNYQDENINDEMLVSYLLGELDAEQNATVLSWMNTDKANAKRVDDLRFILQQVESEKENITVDLDREWKIFQRKINQYSIGKFSVSYRKIFSVAAMFIGFIFIASIAYYYSNSQKIKIASGKQIVSATLPDGSKITLNKNSSLVYTKNFNRKNRRVTLHGEAFFNVRHNASMPFKVSVNDLSVEDIGTSFNIKSDKENTEIVVESGKVKVEKDGSELLLSANEKTEITNNAPLVKAIASDKLYQYYRTKIFNCNSTPLKNLIDALNDSYNQNIVLENDSLENIPITVTFNNLPLDNVLEIVCRTLRLKYRKTQGKIILYRH
ncbi:hypothetical protein A9P82_13860 [Arachidicoccus ginsenosidimutans]|uniref:FecR family protein n=1 Tax=Arachidicoccus sp. BS20 TaxID=1850526 RepID=UPI0007F09485|nr:FecR family protein [Arachidicoccus sp. BS20]ANI90282.1 hypothetical protein A9P82_13860 [Arachidicoccus sp. BS20]